MQVYSSYCSILQALLLTHIHFYSSASYTFQEEIGIALVEDKSGFAGIIEIVKLHGNDGQDYIFTYCLFEDVSRRDELLSCPIYQLQIDTNDSW
ncbi:uncharacterized protein OCT59_019068 [Rhizophagus irregularis]|nr:hypothetical protein OCT59_019068 [Rhizophagus irregularis]GBC34053.2 hypothetical protein GLOIN_2v1771875 [Rhizophagus irregularis DAOM 181602=DAOM 197198]